MQHYAYLVCVTIGTNVYTVLHVEDNVGATPELYKGQPCWPGGVKVASVLTLAIYLESTFWSSEGPLYEPSLMCHPSFESLTVDRVKYGLPECKCETYSATHAHKLRPRRSERSKSPQHCLTCVCEKGERKKPESRAISNIRYRWKCCGACWQQLALS